MKIAERLVIDSQAILVYLSGEPKEERVFEALMRSESWMTLITLGEVAYVIERRDGKAAADDVYAGLLAGDVPQEAPQIRWLAVDADLARRAASLKAGGGMSYADCFVAAAAQVLDCPVLTGDREFEKAEAAGIAVEWLS